MAIVGLHERLTADGSGDATYTLPAVNGLIAVVYVDPVGSVDAGSTAAIEQDYTISGGTTTRTPKSATGASAAVDLWTSADGMLANASNRSTKIVIASAAENDQFDVFVDMM